jgi:NAD(P)-dependent dehydrogenase (short-subunit alcohol dehydrogenase family)
VKGGGVSDALCDKVLLIAGATGALGSAVIDEFALTGAVLALSARSEPRLEKVITRAGMSPDRVLPLIADVTKPGDVDDLMMAIMSRYGRINVLLNCVGGWGGGKPVGETPVEAWDHMLALNLRSSFLLSRAVLPHMLEAGWGRIVHVASKTAVEPRPGQVGYAVSKMGVITLTEVLATEIKRTGITANVILPSVIDTPANRASMPKADHSRWVPPRAIAATMRFLCSDWAGTINGARIAMYGGV